MHSRRDSSLAEYANRNGWMVRLTWASNLRTPDAIRFSSIGNNCKRGVGLIALILANCAAMPGFLVSNGTEKRVKDFYISPYGNDANPGTKEAPFSSFMRADAVVHAGDTVHVLPGAYN